MRQLSSRTSSGCWPGRAAGESTAMCCGRYPARNRACTSIVSTRRSSNAARTWSGSAPAIDPQQPLPVVVIDLAHALVPPPRQSAGDEPTGTAPRQPVTSQQGKRSPLGHQAGTTAGSGRQGRAAPPAATSGEPSTANCRGLTQAEVSPLIAAPSRVTRARGVASKPCSRHQIPMSKVIAAMAQKDPPTRKRTTQKGVAALL